MDLTADEQIVAICTRDGFTQRLLILDLLVPGPPPDGAEWIIDEFSRVEAIKRPTHP